MNEQELEEKIKKAKRKSTILAIVILIEVTIWIVSIAFIITFHIYEEECNKNTNKNGVGFQITAFNRQFEQYEGIRSGSDARALCDLVKNHNNQYADDENLHIQVVIGKATDPNPASTQAVPASEINTVKSTLKAGKKYTITLGYDATTGLITQVGIKEVVE